MSLDEVEPNEHEIVVGKTLSARSAFATVASGYTSADHDTLGMQIAKLLAFVGERGRLTDETREAFRLWLNENADAENACES